MANVSPMPQRSTYDHVCKVLDDMLGLSPQELTPTSRIVEDLGADSLDVVEIVMALEEEFGIEIPDEDTEKLHTVSDVVAYIDRLKGKTP